MHAPTGALADASRNRRQHNHAGLHGDSKMAATTMSHYCSKGSCERIVQCSFKTTAYYHWSSASLLSAIVLHYIIKFSLKKRKKKKSYRNK
jgi:hypothetical protein